MRRGRWTRRTGAPLPALRWLAAGAAFLLTTGSAAAQEAGDSVTLTLADAIRIAEAANPTYVQAENQLGLNGPEARSVWLNEILPSTTVTLLNTGYSGRLQRFGTNDFGNPVPNPDAKWFYDSSTRQGLSLSWDIQGPNFITARRQLQQSQRSRELGVSAARATLRADVSQQYFDALEQQDLLDVEEGLIEARTADLESARRLFELARATQVDVLNAEVQVDQQAINLQQQRRSHEQAVLTLRTTLGDTELPPLRLTREDLPVFDPSVLDEEALVERALRQSPQILESRSSVRGAELSLDDAGAWKWPTLSVSYTAARLIQTQETEALFDIGYDPDELQHSFSIGLSVPFLNNYFQNRYSEAQASVQLQNQRESLKQTRLEVEQNVRAQVINLRNQFESLRLAERSEDIAARATALAREEWRLGARTFVELQATIRQESDARRQTIQARYAFVDAVIALETAVGGPVGPEPGPGAGGGF